MSKALTLELQDVHIERGTDTVTVLVPEHEVRVLQAVHGPDKVRVIGTSDETEDFDSNADAEVGRLRRKYGRINAPDSVRLAYPNGSSDLERFGFSGRGGPAAVAPMSGARDHRKTAKKEAAKTAK